MSEVPVPGAGLPSWRVTCGWLGWISFVAALVMLLIVGQQIFSSALGLALHAQPPSTETAAGWSIGLWVAALAGVAATVLAILGRRWVLPFLAVPVVLIALLGTQGQVAS